MKKTLALAVASLLSLLLVTGCEQDGPSAPAPEPAAAEPSRTEAEPEKEAPPDEARETPLVERAVEIARLKKEIEKNPGDVDALLEAAGLTEEALDALLIEIARSPEAAEAFAGAQ